MSPTPYPLEALLQLRRHQVEVARRDLSEVQALLDELLTLQREMTGTMEAIASRREAERVDFKRRLGTTGTSVGALDLFHQRLAGLDQDEASARRHLEQIQLKVQKTQHHIEKRRQILSDCLAQKEAMENHRDQWEDQQHRLDDRREWEDQEPLAVLRRSPDDRSPHDR